MKRYAEDSEKRLAILRTKDESWWSGETQFFDVRRSRAWVMTRRIAHSAHHRGQQMAMLRMFGYALHSNYGPTADSGGLMQNHAPTIYAYPNLTALFAGESAGGRKSALPAGSDKPVTERPAKQ
jgi:DinB family